MMVRVVTITLPAPDQLEQRIAACAAELKALRRLLRMSRAMHDANEARKRRAQSTDRREGRRNE
jgi:hypothetical protein